MKTFVLGFVKRAVVIPLVITALCFSALYFGIRQYTKSENTDSALTVQTASFDSFSALSDGDVIGRISAGDYENALTFADSVDNSLCLGELSGEPWEGGSIFIFGNSSSDQLGTLRRLSAGDEVKVDLYSDESYVYNITGVKYGLSLDDINKLSNKNRLYLCRSYYDFSGSGKSKLYAVYTADRAKA